MKVLLLSPWDNRNRNSGITKFYDYLYQVSVSNGHLTQKVETLEECKEGAEFDVIFFPNVGVKGRIPDGIAKIRVMTFHTDYILDHGGSYTLKWWKKVKQQSFYKKNEANFYISNSALITQHILRMFGVGTKVIELPHPLVRNMEVTEDVGIRNFLLYIGEVSPRKRILKFLLQYVLKNPIKSKRQIVIVAKPNRHFWKLRLLMLLTNKIRQVENLTDGSLNGLISQSDGILIPSRFESYGLVINEAIHFHRPVHVVESEWTNQHLFSDYLTKHRTLRLMAKSLVENDSIGEMKKVAGVKLQNSKTGILKLFKDLEANVRDLGV